MKVWENLKEYENGILINNNVSIDKEFYLHDQMVKAINDLIALRKNKVMTEYYVGTALTTDKRREEHDRRVYEANGAYDVKYFGYPTEWHIPDNIGRDALNFIIKDDKYSFGYLYAVLKSEEQGYEVAGFDDDVIMYAIDFDIDEVQDALSKIPTAEERITFLIEKRTKSQLVLCTKKDSQLENLKQTFENQIQTIINSEKELAQVSELFRGKPSHCTVKNRPGGMVGGQTRTHSLLYYFSKEDARNPFHISIPDDWASSSSSNRKAFKSILTNLFDVSLDEDLSLIKNEEVWDWSRLFIQGLFNNYVSNQKETYGNNDRRILKSIERWIRITCDILDKVNEQCSYTRPCENGQGFYSRDTSEFKTFLQNIIYSEIVAYAYDHVQEDLPSVPYNFWGDDFGELYNEYSGCLGLDDEKRAIVNTQKNIRYFRARLIEEYIYFANRYFSTINEAKRQEYINKSYQKDCKFLYELYRDFIQRITSKCSNKEEADSLIQTWIIQTISQLLNVFQDNGSLTKSEMGINGQRYEFDNCRTIFFDEICVPIIIQMWKEYYEDVPTVEDFPDNIKSPSQYTVEPKDNQSNKTEKLEGDALENDCNHSSAQVYIEETELKHDSPSTNKLFDTCDHSVVNISVIYEFIQDTLLDSKRKHSPKNTDFGLTEKDFEYAIYNADFKNLARNGVLHHAKEYPYVLITKLKRLFTDEWYKAACTSLGKTPSQINAYHREGVIKTIHQNFPSNITK